MFNLKYTDEAISQLNKLKKDGLNEGFIQQIPPNKTE